MVKKYSSTNPGSINPKTGRIVTELIGLLKAIAKYIEGRSRKAYAVVDYYYIGESTITREDKKERQEWEGKMAEFYVKEGGKWLLLGDYEQSTKK